MHRAYIFHMHRAYNAQIQSDTMHRAYIFHMHRAYNAQSIHIPYAQSIQCTEE